MIVGPVPIVGEGERMSRYTVILWWSAEDGATRQEALANVEVVIAEWVETARELGREIPEPKGRLLFA